MATAYAVVVVIILADTIVAVTAAGIYVSCERDHECGRDKYCYVSSGYCVPCTDCLTHKRENRTSYPYCAKSAVECGKCLPGYEEEILTAGEVRNFCVPVSSESGDMSNALYIVLGILTLTDCVLLAGIFLGYKFYRKQEHDQSIQEECVLEDGCPSTNMSPLLETLPTAVEVGVSDIHETSFSVYGEKDHQPLQQARPFLEPDASYYSSEDQEEPPHTPPHLHDDETLESPWVLPGYGEDVPAYDTDESNNETDNNALPISSQSANTANTSVDSGLSNPCSVVSSVSLPQRPFQDVASTSSATVTFVQPLKSCTRSHSDDDVGTSTRSPKRARLDSGAQSLDEDALPVSVGVLNVQNCPTDSH